MQLLLTALTLVLLLVLSAFFSAAETALFSLTKLEKRRMTERHAALGAWVVKHLEHPRRTLATILVGNLLVNILATAMVTLVAMDLWGSRWIGLVLALFTAILILTGEILPKSLAVKRNEMVALASAPALEFFALLFYPLILLVRFATDKVLSFLVGERKEHAEHMSEDELKTLVKIGEEEGVLDSQERHMIQKLLDLGERPVKDIMTPRTVLAALDLEQSRQEHAEVIRKHHFGHLPVYQNTIDNIIGVVSLQEYMLRPEIPMPAHLKQPLFIPETMPIDDLLEKFRGRELAYGVCVDEYGGTAGIVTLEDILEEIFGEFYDEYAKVENPIRPIGHQEFLVEAKIPITEFNEYFSAALKAEDASTLGGFILETLGEVPEKGRVIELDGFHLRIHDVIRSRYIRSVVVRPKL